MNPIIIIGNGPAGVSAAIHLKRLNHEVIVISKPHTTLGAHDYIENYYGFSNPISGPDLIESGIKQAQNIGVSFIDDTIINITSSNGDFKLEGLSATYHTTLVILATGKKRNELKIPGYQEFRGRGVHLCAACDGFFYRNKKIALIGYGPYFQSELNILKTATKDILLFTKDKLDTSFTTIADDVVRIDGDTRVRSISTHQGSYEVAGVFLALGVPSSLELATKLGIVTEKNNIIVDENFETNISHIFAVGDAIGGKLQIPKAVYDGMMVASIIHQRLACEKKGHH